MGYVEAQQGAHARTAFRNAEKQYKRYKEASTALRSSRSRKNIAPTDVSKVLDFHKYAKLIRDTTTKLDGVSLATGGLPDMPVFVIEGHPGFHFIPQALSVEDQFYWIRESLSAFPQPPNRTNHNAVYGPINDLWSSAQHQRVLVEVATPSAENLACQSGSPRAQTDGFSSQSTKEQLNATVCVTPIESETCFLPESADSKQELQASWPSGVASQPLSSMRKAENGENLGLEVDRDKEGNLLLPLNMVGTEASTLRLTSEAVVEGTKRWSFFDADKYWDRTCKPVPAESLLRKLRWATIGLQFDWSKKAYNTSLPHKELPSKLSQLAARLARPAMDGEQFKAEAAIVNFYGPDDMLGGHIDDMEADWTKPIVSISLGCKAIFLLGGTSKDEPPTAMYLRSGDVVLMAGPARSCFHGVPRIFVEANNSDIPNFSPFEQNTVGPVSNYIKESRININVRQVY